MRTANFIPLAPFALLLGVMSASGISTHFETADRAMPQVDAVHFPELASALNNWPQEVRTGAIYPDWGYLFPKHSAAAEDAHWAPFHTIALQYLHDTYGNPWTPRTERLFAFICGIGGHGAMDDVWHFGSTSFLNQAGSHDLPDWDAGDAETAIEVLTDFFVQAEHRAWSFERYTWWFPAGDLVAIHHLAGHPRMNHLDLTIGINLQRVGMLLEDLLWPLVDPIAAALLPWTKANYLDWYDGGVRDGAEHSARRFESLWDEYVSIMSSQSGRSSSNVSGFAGMGATHRHPEMPGSELLLELAKELVEDGLIKVRWEATTGGDILVHRPTILNLLEVQRRLLSATGLN